MLEKINNDEDLKREMYKYELFEYFEEKKQNEIKEKLEEETKRAEEEKEKNIQMIKNLYGKNMYLEFIAEVSNLSIEEIKKIVE